MSNESHVNSTKKCVAMHTNYFMNFKNGFILQCLSNETFLNSRKLF